MKVENEFEVPESRDAVWKVLDDVPRVVPCIASTVFDAAIERARYPRGTSTYTVVPRSRGTKPIEPPIRLTSSRAM